MSECTPIRDAILEAEPHELDGVGDTEVARHVRTCPACAAVAGLILSRTRTLDEALAQAPPWEPEAVVRRAGLDDVTPRGTPRPGRRWGRARGLRTRTWTPLAAAAALAGLLLLSRQETPLPAPPRPFPAPPPPLVESATGNVAVIETNDPDITVLWFFGEE